MYSSALIEFEKKHSIVLRIDKNYDSYGYYVTVGKLHENGFYQDVAWVLCQSYTLAKTFRDWIVKGDCHA